MVLYLTHHHSIGVVSRERRLYGDEMQTYASLAILSSFVFVIILLSNTTRAIKYTSTDDRSESKSKEKETNINSNSNSNSNPNVKVPFFYNPPINAKETEPPFLHLIKALDRYQKEVNVAISSIVRSENVAQKSEWMIFPQQGNIIHNDNGNDNGNDNVPNGNKIPLLLLSSKIQDRIASTAEILEADGFVLEKLLEPFQFVTGLPGCVDHSYTNSARDIDIGIHSDLFENEESSSYDSAMHVITHIARDWSNLGKSLRHSLYDWCVTQLLTIQHDTQHEHNSHINEMNSVNLSPILVPGAGLGRLAHNIAAVGFNVEANEISIIMSVAAHKFLHGIARGSIHPFAIDLLLNEVDSSRRYQEVSFPDDNDNLNNPKMEMPQSPGSLSYTVGDFVETYATRQHKGRYGSVVTCFFIDTATNIYEYILVIRNVLKSGGVWINVGPLQWHQNAKLHPSVDELRSMVESFGFVVKTWEVDEKPENYRHDEMNNNPRFTKYEGYRSLRFVAILPSRDVLGLQNEDALQKIIDIRTFFRPPKKQNSSGRKAESFASEYDINHTSLVIEEIS